MLLKGSGQLACFWHLFSPKNASSMAIFGLWDKGLPGERQGNQTDLCHRNSIVTGDVIFFLYPGQ